jgi:pyruvate,water dikinase
MHGPSTSAVVMSSEMPQHELEVASVGGKAASLFRLLGMQFPVPEFFVLTAEAYRRNAGGTLCEDDRARIARAFRALGADAYEYAVRSSGVAEDSADFSYAGVFDTILEVRGLNGILEAIERCWASHRSETARAYRSRRGVTSDAAMAVVVQRMVRADWAGVSFSADPLTQALSVTVINATPGLGEKLVSGLVNPEELRIDNATGELLEQRLPAGAASLPQQLRAQVLEVTQRAARLMGFPQDLEWAVEGEKLYLLQSRPITTIGGVFHNRALEPWAGKGTPDATDRVWTRAYADEVWTPPVSPLFYDIQNLTLATAQRLERDGDLAPVPADTFKYFRAAPYMDAAVLARMYAGLAPIARRSSLFALLPAQMRDRAARAPWHWSRFLRRLWMFEVTHGRTWGLERNHRFLERSWQAFCDRGDSLLDVDLTTLDEVALAAHLDEVWSLALSVGPECEIAVLYYAHDIKLVLAGLLERWCGKGEELYGEVSAGLEGSVTVAESQAIWDIAADLRRLGPQAIALASSRNWQEFRAAAPDVAGMAVVQKFEAFLRAHRHRGANYKDMIYPRWGDDPDLLWVHVRAFLQAESAAPAHINAAGAQQRRRAQSECLAGLRGALAPLRRRLLRAAFRFNEIYAGLRDNHRFYYDYVWYLVRGHYVEVGRRLCAQGRLDTADDVFYLVRSEMEALRAGKLGVAEAAARIAVRRREWLETKKSLPPKFLRRGYVPDAGDPVDAASHRLKGLAASSGTVTGRARVVYDVTDLGRVGSGDVLVTRQTDPGWTPAFSRLAALVLETGGVLAHGASLCREYGLPCVTAIEAATTLIADGDLVRVCGGDGTVEVLERGVAA